MFNPVKIISTALLISALASSCGEKNAENSESPSQDSTALQAQPTMPEPLPLNPSRSAFSDYTFDVAIRNDGQQDNLILIMRKGAFMNQITESVQAGNTIKGSGSFDLNGNSKPELIACFGNSSGSGIYISEVDEIGTFTKLAVNGTLPVFPEVVSITSTGNQIAIVDTVDTVLATLESSDSNGKLTFTVK